MPLSGACGPDGAASAALRKKLASLGREELTESLRDARQGHGPLQIAHDGNVESIFLRDRVPGQALQLGLERALQDTIEGLPSPKVMSYASRGSYHNDVKFVRPAHGLLALHGKDVVAVRALGLSAGRTTAGHRFLARRDVEIDDADAYAPTLEAEGKVLPSFGGRRNGIVAGLQAAAGQATLLLAGGTVGGGSVMR